jgi:hypothetical protein
MERDRGGFKVLKIRRSKSRRSKISVSFCNDGGLIGKW